MNAAGQFLAASIGHGCRYVGGEGCSDGETVVDTELVVVFTCPAGGNTFLQPGVSLSLSGIASGQGFSAVAAPALQQLLQQLACLAAPLAALAVQLRR